MRLTRAAHKTHPRHAYVSLICRYSNWHRMRTSFRAALRLNRAGLPREAARTNIIQEPKETAGAEEDSPFRGSGSPGRGFSAMVSTGRRRGETQV